MWCMSTTLVHPLDLILCGIEASDFQALFTTADANYIPSGATGEHEPRFSANLVINGKEEKAKRNAKLRKECP